MFCKRCWTCSQPIRPQPRRGFRYERSEKSLAINPRGGSTIDGDQQIQQVMSGAQSETGLSKVVRAWPCAPGGRGAVWFATQDFRDSGPAVFQQSKYPGRESQWFPFCKTCFFFESGRFQSYCTWSICFVWCHSYCCCIWSSLSGIVRGDSCSDGTSSHTDERFAELTLVNAAGCWHEIFEHLFADCSGACNSLLVFSHWQQWTVSKFHWNVLNCQGNGIINTFIVRHVWFLDRFCLWLAFWYRMCMYDHVWFMYVYWCLLYVLSSTCLLAGRYRLMQESSVGSDDRSKSFRALVALVRNVQDLRSLQTNGVVGVSGREFMRILKMSQDSQANSKQNLVTTLFGLTVWHRSLRSLCLNKKLLVNSCSHVWVQRSLCHYQVRCTV